MPVRYLTHGHHCFINKISTTEGETPSVFVIGKKIEHIIWSKRIANKFKGKYLMGTRHLIAVYADGTHRIAQYGQWDGYPSGQGLNILKFLRTCNIDIFKDKLLKTRFISGKKAYEEKYKKLGIEVDENGYVTMDDGDKFSKAFPELSRDTGSKILDLVYKSENGLELKDAIDFAADSLFCEFAYVIDVDERTFEVYEGFNKIPLDESERFFYLSPKNHIEGKDAAENTQNSEYEPVKLIARFSLNDLPDDDLFLTLCERDGDDPTDEDL